jgi:hypothetical protein
VDDVHGGQLAQADRAAAGRGVPGRDPHVRLELTQAHGVERGGQCGRAGREPAQANVGAAELFLSPSTVRNHLSSIYAKLGVRGQLDLIRLLRRPPVPSADA